MKKLTLILLLVTVSNLAFTQKVITAAFIAKITNSQKHGLESIDGDYLLTVEFDDENMKFNTYEGQTMTSYEITKKTDKYIIGTGMEGNYAFFDIRKKQFYYIDYFMNRYTTAGNGPGYSEVKQNVIKMMDLLKEGATQKDVIKHLIEQAEFDF